MTDHALLRLLERSGFPIAELRAKVEASLTRAHVAAEALGGADHLILVDGLAFVVRGGDVVTVLAARTPAELARALTEGGRR